MREVAKLPMLELDCYVSFSICTTQKNTDKQNKNYTVPIRPGRQDQRDLRVKGFPGFVYRVAA